MGGITDVQRDLVKSMYEQHWLHARHVENERLLVVNVYAILFAGSVAAYKEAFFEQAAMPAHLLLMLLSVFCALFSIKIDAIFKDHTRRADSILQAYRLPSALDKLAAPHWVDRTIRISRLFPYFFALSFCFLLSVVASHWQKLAGHYAYVILPAILFFILVFAIDRLSYDSTLRGYEPCSFPRRNRRRSTLRSSGLVSAAAELKR